MIYLVWFKITSFINTVRNTTLVPRPLLSLLGVLPQVSGLNVHQMSWGQNSTYNWMQDRKETYISEGMCIQNLYTMCNALSLLYSPCLCFVFLVCLGCSLVAHSVCLEDSQVWMYLCVDMYSMYAHMYTWRCMHDWCTHTFGLWMPQGPPDGAVGENIRTALLNLQPPWPRCASGM